MLVLNEAPSRRFEFPANRDHGIALTPILLRSAVKNSLGDMNPGESIRILFLQFMTQRQETADMVAVEVSEDNFLDMAQIDVQLASIF